MSAVRPRGPGRIKVVSRKSKPVRVSNQHLLPDLDPTTLPRRDKWLYRHPVIGALGFAVCDLIVSTAIIYWRSSKPLGEILWGRIPPILFLSVFVYFMLRQSRRRYFR